MESKEVDLGAGTFLEKWPIWLRWLLFLPASIIAPLIFLIIQSITTQWYLGLGPDAFAFNLIRGVAYGAGTIVVGAMVAPKKQRIVALCYLVIISMISGIAFLEQLRHFVLNGFLEDLITIGAASWATYYIFNETK